MRRVAMAAALLVLTACHNSMRTDWLKEDQEKKFEEQRKLEIGAQKIQEARLARLPAVPLLTSDGPRMEGIVSGRLEREGKCLYLATDHARAPIVWGDEVRVLPGDGDAWSLVDVTTSQGIREGDTLVGQGGVYPDEPELDFAAIAEPDISSDCNGRPVLVYRAIANPEPPRDGKWDNPVELPPPIPTFLKNREGS